MESQSNVRPGSENSFGWLIAFLILFILILTVVIASIAGAKSADQKATTLTTLEKSGNLAPKENALFAGPKAESTIALSEVAPAPDIKPSRLGELRGRLARRREYDVWLIRNLAKIVNSQSGQEKVLSYCMVTIYGAEHANSAPETEYALQPDGSVLATKLPKTPEQSFRDQERSQLELETGGGPAVQNCAGSLVWFRTWHNQPMPTDEQFVDLASKTQADLDEIDSMLDARLVERLPKPARIQ
jgi:hypothetical protein